MNQWQLSADKMDMISVEEAEGIIFSHSSDYGAEEIFYENALGRVLAEDLRTDRHLPPFNRPTVDGIALLFSSIEKGITRFRIRAIQAAGEAPVPVTGESECVEIMTGAALDTSADTVIRYEDLVINEGWAEIRTDPATIRKGQNIHSKGKDKKQGEILVPAHQSITPAILGIAASVGKTILRVRKLPKVVIISTGDEMVSPETAPNDFQLRRSNGTTVRSVLEKYKVSADLLHLNDDPDEIREALRHCLEEYDILLICGGVSMGKFDFVPRVLEELGTIKLFHKIKQRPGKPFWFGKTQPGRLIFAFPGNPVSVFMCLHRYFVPWLEKSLGIPISNPVYAILQNDVTFPAPLQYFTQVRLSVSPAGQLLAETMDTNGSGDFSHLAEAHAFMELPADKNQFKKGEVYQVWPYAFLT